MAKKTKQPKTYEQFEKTQVVETVPADKRTVKCRVLREFEIDKQLQRVGSIVMLTEDEAKEFCDRKFAGYHPFYGYMPEIGPLMEGENPLQRKEIVRAERVA